MKLSDMLKIWKDEEINPRVMRMFITRTEYLEDAVEKALYLYFEKDKEGLLEAMRELDKALIDLGSMTKWGKDYD